jgi:hypothetical protein
MSRGAKEISLGSGLGAALALSLSGAALLAAVGPPLGVGTALRLVIALLAFGYVLYLMAASGERVGRITTVVLWASIAGGTWLLGLPFGGYVLVHVGLIWLVRSLYCYSGVLPALVDLALSAVGVAFAVWAATRSHSAALAFWCFFLVQAFHVSIPAALAGRAKSRTADEGRAFDRAHRAAEAAVRRLSEVR